MANKNKRLFIGDQEGLKLADDSSEISEEEAKFRTYEMKKCWEDIDYFVEHYYHIIDNTGERRVIKMYPKQREFLHKIKDRNRVICLAARQLGKSETYSMFCTYQIITQKNYKIMIAGNKGEIAREILTKIKEAYELVPNWMKPSIKTWNESKIVFSNGCVIKATTTCKQSARGNTSSLVILDEFSFVLPSIQSLFYKAIVPSISSKKDGKLIIVSTPNGTGDVYHDIWKDATTKPDTIWTAHRMDWWDRPDRDENWKKEQIQTLGSEEAFQQEFGNSFLVQAGDKLVSDDRILHLKDVAEKSDIVKMILPIDPKKPELKLNYTQYFPHEEGKTYVMGVDSAEGTGRDASIAYVLDITKTSEIKLAAKFESAKAIPTLFAYAIYRLYLKYKNPKLMIESNAVGLAVIEALKGIANDPKLMNSNKFAAERFYMSDIVNYNRPAGHTGIMSNNQSKSNSMLNLQSIVQSNNFNLIIGDDELFKELPFCEKRSGSGNVTYKANKDHHDDHILALNWALFILSKDLIERHYTVEYAIDNDTNQKYPVLVLPMDTDIQEYKKRQLTSQLSMDEAYDLAMKWKRMGDHARAGFILQQIFEREFDDNGDEWGRNPFGIDTNQFSEKFRKQYFYGYGEDAYFKPPISDPHDAIEDSYGFGWEF